MTSKGRPYHLVSKGILQTHGYKGQDLQPQVRSERDSRRVRGIRGDYRTKLVLKVSSVGYEGVC